MDPMIEIKTQNLINEISNQLTNDHVDDYVVKIIFQLTLSRIKILLTHIGYLESKLDSVNQLNKNLQIQLENTTAENQRLNSIVKY